MLFDPHPQRHQCACHCCDSRDCRDSNPDMGIKIAGIAGIATPRGRNCVGSDALQGLMGRQGQPGADRSAPACDCRDSAIFPAPLVTVRPGPVLHVWQDGQQTAAITLAPSAALCLKADLLRALQALNLKESP